MDALARHRPGPQWPGRREAAKNIRLVRPLAEDGTAATRPDSLRLKADTEHSARPVEDLAVTRIAARFAPDPQAGAEGNVLLGQQAPQLRSRRARGWDGRMLTAWIAAALLLLGLAAVAMIAMGVMDLSRSSGRLAGHSPNSSPVLTASAGGKPSPIVQVAPSKPAEPQPPPPIEAEPEAQPVDSSEDSSQPDAGSGLFSEMSMVRVDGQAADVPFGAIYASPEASADSSLPANDAASAATEPQEGLPQTRDQTNGDQTSGEQTDENQAKSDGTEPSAATDDANATWIVLPNAVNLRKSPSVSAGVIRAMKKGSKLKVISRKRGWVQVTDAEAKTRGWLYPAAKPGARTTRATAEKAADSKTAESKGFFATVGDWLSQ